MNSKTLYVLLFSLIISTICYGGYPFSWLYQTSKKKIKIAKRKTLVIRFKTIGIDPEMLIRMKILENFAEKEFNENNYEKEYTMAIYPKPNLQLIYVSDIKRSTDFYKTLFNSDPVFSSPRYVAFAAGAEALFAIWTGGTTPDVSVPRFSEIGIMLPSNQDVDHLFDKWKKNPNIKIVQEPRTEVFGRTFLIEDPDHHIIRVCRKD